jgi:hypothetical protein
MSVFGSTRAVAEHPMAPGLMGFSEDLRKGIEAYTRILVSLWWGRLAEAARGRALSAKAPCPTGGLRILFF